MTKPFDYHCLNTSVMPDALLIHISDANTLIETISYNFHDKYPVINDIFKLIPYG